MRAGVVEVFLVTGSAVTVGPAAGTTGSAATGTGVGSITGVAVWSAGMSALCAKTGAEDKAMTAAMAVTAGRIIFEWFMQSTTHP